LTAVPAVADNIPPVHASGWVRQRVL